MRAARRNGQQPLPEPADGMGRARWAGRTEGGIRRVRRAERHARRARRGGACGADRTRTARRNGQQPLSAPADGMGRARRARRPDGANGMGGGINQAGASGRSHARRARRSRTGWIVGRRGRGRRARNGQQPLPEPADGMGRARWAGRRDGRLPLPDLRTGWDEQTGRAEETGPKCRQEVAEPRTAQQKSVPPDLPGWDA